eukprot:CAMPEP_0172600770 /NCGR_PEP_ID=MMETSP1068-20121228/20930_1 /TAXON_ID=35684 /ORGANISM="Pseudopedinella elastica, Strain CCMP716" /LENGTH=202 /DNA_ID=CAMNT_0013401537 /DNA_START=78 /DNA_END=686 /DNA_ORIENTATION=+
MVYSKGVMPREGRVYVRKFFELDYHPRLSGAVDRMMSALRWANDAPFAAVHLRLGDNLHGRDSNGLLAQLIEVAMNHLEEATEQIPRQIWIGGDFLDRPMYTEDLLASKLCAQRTCATARSPEVRRIIVSELSYMRAFSSLIMDQAFFVGASSFACASYRDPDGSKLSCGKAQVGRTEDAINSLPSTFDLPVVYKRERKTAA